MSVHDTALQLREIVVPGVPHEEKRDKEMSMDEEAIDRGHVGDSSPEKIQRASPRHSASPVKKVKPSMESTKRAVAEIHLSPSTTAPTSPAMQPKLAQLARETRRNLTQESDDIPLTQTQQSDSQNSIDVSQKSTGAKRVIPTITRPVRVVSTSPSPVFNRTSRQAAPASPLSAIKEGSTSPVPTFKRKVSDSPVSSPVKTSRSSPVKRKVSASPAPPSPVKRKKAKSPAPSSSPVKRKKSRSPLKEKKAKIDKQQTESPAESAFSFGLSQRSGQQTPQEIVADEEEKPETIVLSPHKVEIEDNSQAKKKSKVTRPKFNNLTKKRKSKKPNDDVSSSDDGDMDDRDFMQKPQKVDPLPKKKGRPPKSKALSQPINVEEEKAPVSEKKTSLSQPTRKSTRVVASPQKTSASVQQILTDESDKEEHQKALEREKKASKKRRTESDESTPKKSKNVTDVTTPKNTSSWAEPLELSPSKDSKKWQEDLTMPDDDDDDPVTNQNSDDDLILTQKSAKKTPQKAPTKSITPQEVLQKQITDRLTKRKDTDLQKMKNFIWIWYQNKWWPAAVFCNSFFPHKIHAERSNTGRKRSCCISSCSSFSM